MYNKLAIKGSFSLLVMSQNLSRKWSFKSTYNLVKTNNRVVSRVELNGIRVARIRSRAVNLTRLQIWRISLPRPAITKHLTEAWHQGQIHRFSGGRKLNSTRNNAIHFRFSCQKVESTTNGKLHQLSGRLQT